MSESNDPTVIRSIAVTAEDVVTAYEAGERAGRDAILRVTPPFSGRMRARLHAADVVEVIQEDGGPPPVEIPPRDLLADVPPYPDPDETEDELRADPEVEYTPERHHRRHRQVVNRWRERVRAGIREAVTVETPTGPHEIDVVVLGR